MEFSQTSNGYRVDHYGVEPLPSNAVTEKVISDVDAVGESIRQVMKKSSSKAKNCCLAVAGSAVITKVITMPANLSEEDLEGQIQLEADQYIPYALEEVNLDFDILGPTEENPETIDVLLAASRSENVDMRVAAAKAAGLTPIVIDVEAYAIENVFPILTETVENRGRDKTVAILDIGATMTSLNVLDDHKMVYTREQPFGGKQLTEEIMHQYGLTFEEAGLAKKQGGLPDDYEQEVLEPFKEAVVQQITRSLQFFFSSSPYNDVDFIVLAGGVAAMPGLCDLVQERLGTPAAVANPFANMAVASKVNSVALGNDAPAMMIACGLAMRSFA